MAEIEERRYTAANLGAERRLHVMGTELPVETADASAADPPAAP